MSNGKSETRSRILDATVALLESRAGIDVRMSDIAKAAGISRQALYLHFVTRAELLIETTHHLDRIHNREERLHRSRTANTGGERLEAFIEAWGGYIPDIYSVAKALIAMRYTDEAAAEAWNKRMQDMREGCEAAVLALKNDNKLRPGRSVQEATDLLWTILSVRNWEQLVGECGWTQEQYVHSVKQVCRQLFIADG